jgi:hypothetical protein
LTDIQNDILAVLGIPQHYFNYAYLFNSTWRQIETGESWQPNPGCRK